MDNPKPIDWRWADRHDTSDAALRAAIGGTLVGAPGAADVLALRYSRRCVHKVMTALFGKYPDVTKPDMEELVDDAAADVVLRIQAGKLTEFTETPTGYLYTTAENKIKARGRQKKGHEVPFSQLAEEPQGGGLLSAASTEAYLTTLSPPRARPHRIVIAREMVRALAAQVGRLPRGLRQVAARTRQGMGYRDIAQELGRSESTVRSQYDKAEEILKGWLDSNGAVSAWFLQKKAPLVSETHAGVQRELVNDFLISLSQDCWWAFMEVHLNGKRVSEASQILGVCRAEVEALLAYAYWAMWRKGRFLFPRDFLKSLLPQHPRYPDHIARFSYW